MSKVGSYILKLILGVVVDKISGPLIAKIKGYVAKKKFDKKADEDTKGVTDAKTKLDLEREHNNLP